SGPDGTVVVPDTINGYPVSSIGDYAFQPLTIPSFGITNVVIGNNVKSIGEGAFADCSGLSNINIPASVTSLGQLAFIGSGLIAVSIHANVTNIGFAAFAVCNALTNISVDGPASIYSSAGGVLFDKMQTMLIQAPGGLSGDYEIPDTATN